MKFKLLLSILCALLLSACASLPQQSIKKYPDQESQSCADFFSQLEQTVSKAGVIDSQAARINGYPYLRINRFLSDFRNQKMNLTSFNLWVERMQNLAKEGLLIELSNLSTLEKEKVSFQRITANSDLSGSIQYCGELLRSIDLDEENERQHLKSIAKAPDQYKTWQRVIGLYPLTAMLFRAGIISWHKETNEVYKQPLEALETKGELIAYLPSANYKVLSEQDVSQIIKDSSNNSLHIPEPSANDKQKLFDSFAPIFEIDTLSNDDRIGTVELDKESIAKINTNLKNVYQHLSNTPLHDQNLLQLNNSIWFPARPKTSSFDILAGHLDGITWRVTLLSNGKPLLFDSIHNCGCYHLFFPTQHAIVLPQAQSFEEPIFIPQTVSVNSSERPVIRIAHSSHYIERVYFKNRFSSNSKHYQLKHANALRSLKLDNDGNRSLFDEEGIIQSSQRGERYFFWPMGIPSPGAMRQWGHHATAFVGRRYFDDARLFEKYFDIP